VNNPQLSTTTLFLGDVGNPRSARAVANLGENYLWLGGDPPVIRQLSEPLTSIEQFQSVASVLDIAELAGSAAQMLVLDPSPESQGDALLWCPSASDALRWQAWCPSYGFEAGGRPSGRPCFQPTSSALDNAHRQLLATLKEGGLSLDVGAPSGEAVVEIATHWAVKRRMSRESVAGISQSPALGVQWSDVLLPVLYGPIARATLAQSEAGAGSMTSHAGAQGRVPPRSGRRRPVR